MACKSLTVGETITASGLTGHYQNVANSQQKGDASGSFTFQVSNLYVGGCTLLITGGTITLDSPYTVTGGTVVLSKGGYSGEGWGTTSSGSFLIQVNGIHASTSTLLGALSLDFKTGSSEFQVFLHS